jgi:hypothetical protein
VIADHSCMTIIVESVLDRVICISLHHQLFRKNAFNQKIYLWLTNNEMC